MNVSRVSLNLLLLTVLFSGFAANAEVIDPETHILKNGYHSEQMGDDGKTRFYIFFEKESSRTSALESEIAKLPKHEAVQNMCNTWGNGAKALMLEQQGIALDVTLTDHGHSGATVACVLKWMHENNVRTQLIYSKKGSSGMYMVYVTD